MRVLSVQLPMVVAAEAVVELLPLEQMLVLIREAMEETLLSKVQLKEIAWVVVEQKVRMVKVQVAVQGLVVIALSMAAVVAAVLLRVVAI